MPPKKVLVGMSEILSVFMIRGFLLLWNLESVVVMRLTLFEGFLTLKGGSNRVRWGSSGSLEGGQSFLRSTLKWEVRNLLVRQTYEAPWLLSTIYASTDVKQRESLWEALSCAARQHNYPWLVAGDLNLLGKEEDKVGGTCSGHGRIRRFTQWMDACNLVDLGCMGARFTWSNSWDTGRRIMERLDRAHANPAWRMQFPNAVVHNLPRRCSDHRTILISNIAVGNAFRGRSFFKFEAAWMAHKDFDSFLRSNWCINNDIRMNIHHIRDKLGT